MNPEAVGHAREWLETYNSDNWGSDGACGMADAAAGIFELLLKDVSTPRQDAFRALAKEQYHDEGTCEIDDDAIVSMDEESEKCLGAYVQAWVWVDNPDEEDE